MKSNTNIILDYFYNTLLSIQIWWVICNQNCTQTTTNLYVIETTFTVYVSLCIVHSGRTPVFYDFMPKNTKKIWFFMPFKKKSFDFFMNFQTNIQLFFFQFITAVYKNCINMCHTKTKNTLKEIHYKVVKGVVQLSAIMHSYFHILYWK